MKKCQPFWGKKRKKKCQPFWGVTLFSVKEFHIEKIQPNCQCRNLKEQWNSKIKSWEYDKYSKGPSSVTIQVYIVLEYVDIL